MSKTHNRRYYAECCPYGLNTLSAANSLLIFDTKVERDAMVKYLNEDFRYNLCHVEGVARAITRKEASEDYRTQDFHTDGEVEVGGLRTCYDRCVFEVGSKRCGKLD